MTLDEKKELALLQDINVLLQNLGYQPTKKTSRDTWYISPFNPSEKTASFHVSQGTRIRGRSVWSDFSTGKGGNIIHLVRELKGLPYGKALDFILDYTNQHSLISRINTPPTPAIPPSKNIDRYKIEQVKEIRSPAILNYLAKERGLDRAVIKTYLKQVHFLDTQTNKPFYAAGIPNEKGGYEVNHKLGKKFKSAIPSNSKSISFIEGNLGEKKKIQVFGGFINALSHIVYQNITQLQKSRYFDIDTLILNSDRLSKDAIQFIQTRNYEQVMGYFDHDKSGYAVLAEFEQAFEDKVTNCSGIYEGVNDYNEFLVGCSKTNFFSKL